MYVEKPTLGTRNCYNNNNDNNNNNENIINSLNMHVHTIENLASQVIYNWLLEITNILCYFNTLYKKLYIYKQFMSSI